MAVKSEERTIGEHTYRVTQLTALKSRELFSRLVRLLGPGVAAMVSAGQGISRSQISQMLGEISQRVTDDELDHFCRVLGSSSQIVAAGNAVTLDKEVIDVHFAGQLFNLFKWLAFALEVNYSDFLSVFARMQAAVSAAAAKSPSPSPPASIGTFGAS
jgi:hypothetical protein